MLKNACHFVSVSTSSLADDKNIRLNFGVISLTNKIIMQIKIYIFSYAVKEISLI